MSDHVPGLRKTGSAGPSGGRTYACRRFGRFRREEHKSLKACDVGRDDVSQQLLGAMRESYGLASFECDPTGFHEGQSSFQPGPLSSVYACYPHIYQITYTKHDIERFILSLPDPSGAVPNGFASHFIEALLRMHRMERLRIPQAHIEGGMDYLGAFNSNVLLADGDAGVCAGSGMTDGLLVLHGSADELAGNKMGGGVLLIKQDCSHSLGLCMGGGIIIVEGNAGNNAGSNGNGGIIIRGDAGDAVGSEMVRGNVIVEGDAGDYAGYRTTSWNSHITIFGDAGDYVGAQMEGGHIHVYGDAGEKIGEGMTNGMINLHGDFGSIGAVRRGSIYHKGILIVDK